MKNKLIVLFAVSIISPWCSAQVPDIRFFVRPYKAVEGETMLFNFIPETTIGNVVDGSLIPTMDIKSWRWDFDGSIADGIDHSWDFEDQFFMGEDVNNNGLLDPGEDVNSNGILDGPEAKNPGRINAVWQAEFNPSEAVDDEQVITPTLEITKNDGSVITQIGVTQSVFGDETVDSNIFVEKQDAGAGTGVSVSFSATPRLANVDSDGNAEIRFFLNVVLEDSNDSVDRIRWEFGDETTIEDRILFRTKTYTLPENSPPLALTVKVIVYLEPGTDKGIEFEFPDYIKIIDVPESLSLGRAYRRGFPEEYGWDDIIRQFQADLGSTILICLGAVFKCRTDFSLQS